VGRAATAGAAARDEPHRPRGGLADVLFGLRYLAGKPILLLSFGIDIVAMVLAQRGRCSRRWPTSGTAAPARSAGCSRRSRWARCAGLTSGWISRVKRRGWR